MLRVVQAGLINGGGKILRQVKASFTIRSTLTFGPSFRDHLSIKRLRLRVLLYKKYKV